MSDTDLTLKISADPDGLAQVRAATEALKAVLSGAGMSGGTGAKAATADLQKMAAQAKALSAEIAVLEKQKAKLIAATQKAAAVEAQHTNQIKLATASLSQLAQVEAGFYSQLKATKQEVIGVTIAMQNMSASKRMEAREVQALHAVNQMANKEFAASVGLRAAVKAQSDAMLPQLQAETLALAKKAYLQGVITAEQYKAMAAERGYQLALDGTLVKLRAVSAAGRERALVQSVNARLAMADMSLGLGMAKMRTDAVAAGVALRAKEAATARAAAATNIHSAALNTNTAAAAANLRATRGLTQGQMELHGALRGAAGASGALWLTYGRIVPLLAAVSVISTGLRSFRIGSEFETELRYIQGLSQETSASIDGLSESILELARTTIYTPTQIVKGMRVLMQAGLSTRQAMEGIVPVLRLARVGEMEVADAANLAQTAMHAFGLTAGEIEHIVNTLGQAASMSATNVKEMAAAMTTGSEVGALYGTQLEEMNASLTVLAQRHLVGQSAGTAFKNMMRDIGGVTKEAQEMVKGLGIETHDLNGELRPLIPLLGEIKRSLAEFDPASRQRIMRQWMTRRGIRAFVPLLEEAEGFLIEAYAAMLTASEGVPVAKSIEDQLTQAFSGQQLIAVAKFESTLIDAFRRVEMSAASMIERIGELGRTEGFTRFVDGVVGGSVRAVHFLLDHQTAILNLAKAYLVYKTAMIGAMASAAAVTALANLAQLATTATAAGAASSLMAHRLALLIPHVRVVAIAVAGVTAALALLGGKSQSTSADIRIFKEDAKGAWESIKTWVEWIYKLIEAYDKLPKALKIVVAPPALSASEGMAIPGPGQIMGSALDVGAHLSDAVFMGKRRLEESRISRELAQAEMSGASPEYIARLRQELETHREVTAAIREHDTAVKTLNDRRQEIVEAPQEFRKHEHIVAENQLRLMRERLEMSERLAKMSTEEQYAYLDARAAQMKADRELAAATQILNDLFAEELSTVQRLRDLQNTLAPTDFLRVMGKDASGMSGEGMTAAVESEVEQLIDMISRMYGRRRQMQEEHIEYMKRAEKEGAIFLMDLFSEIQGALTRDAEKLRDVDTWEQFEEGTKKIRDRIAEIRAELTATGQPLAQAYVKIIADLEAVIAQSARLAAPAVRERTVADYMAKIGFADPDFYRHELTKIMGILRWAQRDLDAEQTRRLEARLKQDLADRFAKDTGLEEIAQIKERTAAIGLSGEALDRYNDQLVYQKWLTDEVKQANAEKYLEAVRQLRDEEAAHRRKLRLQEHELEVAQALARLELGRATRYMGASEAAHQERKLGIRQQGEKEIQRHRETGALDAAADAGNQMLRMLELEDQARADSLEKMQDWKAGMLSAYADWVEGVSDHYEIFRGLTTDTFQSLSSVFSDFFFDPFNASLEEMALNFARTMQRMIADALAAQAASALLGLAMGAIGTAGASKGLDSLMATSGLWHNGGVVGVDRPTAVRQVPVGMFAAAPRLHSGLRSDEFPAILQYGERVTSRREVEQERRDQTKQHRSMAVTNNFLLNDRPDLRTQNQIAYKVATTQRRVQARLGG